MTTMSYELFEDLPGDSSGIFDTAAALDAWRSGKIHRFTNPKAAGSTETDLYDEYYDDECLSYCTHFFMVSPAVVLKYDFNGGSGAEGVDYSDYDYAISQTAVTKKEAVRENYSFIGWNTKQDGSGVMYQATENLIMPDHDVTLYTQWREITYGVTYDWGTDAPSDVTLPTDTKSYKRHDSVTADSTYTSSSTSSASRNGVPGTWTFSGWTANDKLTADGIEGDVVFTGAWTFTPKTHKVEYVVNGDDTYGLPEDSKTPLDPTAYNYKDLVAVADALVSDCKYAIVDGKEVRGTWKFVIWDKGDFRIAEDTVITGSWQFTPDETPITPDSPQTGENSDILLWLALLFISVGALGGVYVYETRKKSRFE